MHPPGARIVPTPTTPAPEPATVSAAQVSPAATRSFNHVSGTVQGNTATHDDLNALAWYEPLVRWLTTLHYPLDVHAGLTGQHALDDFQGRYPMARRKRRTTDTVTSPTRPESLPTPTLSVEPVDAATGQVTVTTGQPVTIRTALTQAGDQVATGDGTLYAAAPTLTHTYARGGVMTALIWRGNAPLAGGPTVPVTVRTIAPRLAVSPASPQAGELVTVTVDPVEPGDLLDFGEDEPVAAARTQGHRWNAGTYTLHVLRAGVSVATLALTVAAAPVPAPPVQFSVSPLRTSPGSVVRATASAYPPGTRLDWGEGPSVPMTGTAERTYPAGTYTARLVDAQGQPLPGVATYSVSVVATPGVTVRSRDPEDLPWTAPLRIEENIPSTYAQFLQTDGSIRLTDRFLRSDNPRINALHLRTQRPLIITGGATYSAGQPMSGANGAIYCDTPRAHLTVREHLIYSGNPGVDGFFPARAIVAPNGAKVFDIEGVEEYGCSGNILIHPETGGRIEKLRFKRIYLLNIDGRISAGPGAWRPGNLHSGPAAAWRVSNILQLIDVVMDNVDVFEVSDIENENRAGESRLEDAWAFQRSGGVPGREMVLERVKMRGNYVYDEAWQPGDSHYGNNTPVGTGGTAAIDEWGRYKNVRGKVHSGGQGLIADGTNPSLPERRRGNRVVFRRFYALNSANYGLAINGGVQSTLEDCVALSDGYVHNLQGGRTVKIPTIHLPIQFQYGHGGVPDSQSFSGHRLIRTRFGHRYFPPSGGSVRTEGSNGQGKIFKITPNCTQNGVLVPAFTETGSVYEANPTPEMVDAAWKELDAYWHTHGIAVGLADRIPALP